VNFFNATVKFSYKALNPYKAGLYSYGLELWKDGKRLGLLSGGSNLGTKDGDLGISVYDDSDVAFSFVQPKLSIATTPLNFVRSTFESFLKLFSKSELI
jgi:hypothetical protein